MIIDDDEAGLQRQVEAKIGRIGSHLPGDLTPAEQGYALIFTQLAQAPEQGVSIDFAQRVVETKQRNQQRHQWVVIRRGLVLLLVIGISGMSMAWVDARLTSLVWASCWAARGWLSFGLVMLGLSYYLDQLVVAKSGTRPRVHT